MSFLVNPQYAVKGSIINIPVEINNMVKMLPRKFDEIKTIQLKLKRHMEFAGHYMFETIRPSNVCEALNYLKGTPSYQTHNMSIDDKFFAQYDTNSDKLLDFVVNEEDKLLKSNPPTSQPCSFFGDEYDEDLFRISDDDI